MKKKYFKALFMLTTSILLVHCATPKPQMSRTMFKPHEFQVGQYRQTVDNFMVILDRSHSMEESYQGRTKYDTAKKIIKRMNATIPDLELQGALRTFGFGTCCTSGAKSDLIYGLTPYSESELAKSLESIPYAGGNSDMAFGIESATEDLKSTQGETAIIILSDGKILDSSPVAAAESLKRLYGESLCINTIQIGDDPAGKMLMEKVAGAGECGVAVNGDDIYTSDGMAGFVEKVFLSASLDSDGDGVLDAHDQCPGTVAGLTVDKTGCALDSDGDGVYNDMDRCPNTPKGVAVNTQGCPLDSDGDGVYDDMDRCPNTPKDVKVDDQGCPLDSDGDGVYNYLDQCPQTPMGAKVNAQGCWSLGGVQFSTGTWDVRPSAFPELDAIVKVLQNNSDLKVEIQGHTDNVGSQASNMKLSERRATAVMEYLLGKGIPSERLSARGYGFSRPMASNSTAEGRAQNRRVQLQPMH